MDMMGLSNRLVGWCAILAGAGCVPGVSLDQLDGGHDVPPDEAFADIPPDDGLAEVDVEADSADGVREDAVIGPEDGQDDATVTDDGDLEDAPETEDVPEADDAGADDAADPCPGGWLDPATNLCWEIPTITARLRDAAADHCADLALADGAAWRLPTISEFRTLVRSCAVTATGGACPLTEGCLDSGCSATSACAGCPSGAGPSGGCYWPSELGASCGWFWTSSEPPGYVNFYWGLAFNNAAIYGMFGDCTNAGVPGVCYGMCVHRTVP